MSWGRPEEMEEKKKYFFYEQFQRRRKIRSFIYLSSFFNFFFRLTTREGHQKLKNNHPQYKLWNRQNQKKEILSTGVDMLFLGIQKEMFA